MVRKSKPKRRSKRTRRARTRPRKPAASRKKPLRRRKRLRSSPLIEIAVREMNRGRSLTAAARSLKLRSDDLRKTLKQLRLLKRKGKRWVINDDRPRRVPVSTGGRQRNLTVRGYEQVSFLGEYHHAVGKFLETNDPRVLKRFRGRTVTAANGRQYLLETDPNALHRIAAMDTPPFHEIYEITSNT
jgi:hypothetical protein